MLHASVGARATIAPKKIQQKSLYNTLFDSVIHVMGKFLHTLLDVTQGPLEVVQLVLL